MVFGEVGYLSQHHLSAVHPALMVLFVLASRHTSQRGYHELVLNNVWRCFNFGDDILCRQGKARVYRSCAPGEERVKECCILSMVLRCDFIGVCIKFHRYLEQNHCHVL